MLPTAATTRERAVASLSVVPIAVGVMGFSYATTQLALLRELLGAFSGNEMVLGFVLGGWLLLMGLGTLAGRFARTFKNPVLVLAFLQGLMAVLPPVQIFLIRALRNLVFTRGADIGPLQTLSAVLVILLPYCLVGGSALTAASAICSRREGPRGIGHVYLADALGSIAGGLLFSLVLVHWLDHIGILLVSASMNLLAVAALAGSEGRTVLRAVAVAVAALLPPVGFLANPDAVSLKLQYPSQHVYLRANSAYGNLLVLESGKQLDFLQNNLPIASSRDDWRVEETVHYAMAQRPTARRVLLAGGSIGGAPAEVLKYSTVEQLDCVELDPALIRLGQQVMPEKLEDRRIHLIALDARWFVRSRAAALRHREPARTELRTPPPYDVVLVDVPLPSTAQLNRFFTAEFFQEARGVMTPGGVLAFSLGEYGNYISPGLGRVLACARTTLSSCFRNVKLLPGERVFFLASDGPLFDDIASRLEAAGIENRLLKRHYLETQLAPDRVNELTRAVAMVAPVNRDFDPVLYFYHLQHWLSQFDSRLGFFSAIAALALLAYMLSQKATALVLFASGFAGMALQMVLMLMFQVLCGSLYYQVGVIVSVFMVGLAAGAWLANRRPPEWPGSRRGDVFLLRLVTVLVAVFALFLPNVLRLGAGWDTALGIKAMFWTLAFLLAGLLGLQFPIANRIQFDLTAAPVSRLYTADFLGAFAGALVTCTLLIPLIGVTAVCYLTAGLNLVAAVIFGLRSRFS